MWYLADDILSLKGVISSQEEQLHGSFLPFL
jgi:hypothetical protein